MSRSLGQAPNPALAMGKPTAPTSGPKMAPTVAAPPGPRPPPVPVSGMPMGRGVLRR